MRMKADQGVGNIVPEELWFTDFPGKLVQGIPAAIKPYGETEKRTTFDLEWRILNASEGDSLGGEPLSHREYGCIEKTRYQNDAAHLIQLSIIFTFQEIEDLLLGVLELAEKIFSFQICVVRQILERLHLDPLFGLAFLQFNEYSISVLIESHEIRPLALFGRCLILGQSSGSPMLSLKPCV